MLRMLINIFISKGSNLYPLLMIAFLPCLPCISENPRKVIVLSFDGFRYDYPNANLTPTFMNLSSEGTRAEFLHNVFETKTFPNHHSIATGLYPDVHGVIANSFFDPFYGRVLTYSEEMWSYGDNIVPIWIHNEEGGEGRHSGVYMWPGSNFKFKNKLPTFVKSFNSSVPWIERIDTVVSWLSHPETPANFVMMYFEEPDFHSHHYGPDSIQVKEQIRRVDNITNYLGKSLTQRNLSSSVNVFLLSDHGMASVPPSHLIQVTKLIVSHCRECIMAGISPILHVVPPENLEDDLYSALKNLSQNSQFAVYRKSELPPEWLYINSRRIPPIMLVANDGYAFDDIERNGTEMYGAHGYDNKLKDMHPFFIAYGPQIKKNYTIDPFKTVDLFSLFCQILDLEMLETNGSLDIVHNMLLPLQGKENEILPISNVMISLASISVLFLGYVLIATVRSMYYYCIRRRYEANGGFSVSKEFENVHLLDSDDME